MFFRHVFFKFVYFVFVLMSIESLCRIVDFAQAKSDVYEFCLLSHSSYRCLKLLNNQLLNEILDSFLDFWRFDKFCKRVWNVIDSILIAWCLLIVKTLDCSNIFYIFCFDYRNSFSLRWRVFSCLSWNFLRKSLFARAIRICTCQVLTNRAFDNFTRNESEIQMSFNQSFSINAQLCRLLQVNSTTYLQLNIETSSQTQR